MGGGINRFNRISSKEWLPFQKSWFQYESNAAWIRSNFRFFTTKEDSDCKIIYEGPEKEAANKEAAELGFLLVDENIPNTEPVQFGFFDLREKVVSLMPADWKIFRDKFIAEIRLLFDNMLHRRFIMVALPNVASKGGLLPYAWDLAGRLGQTFTLKDEKIACWNIGEHSNSENKGNEYFYCLYFRKDENSGLHKSTSHDYFRHKKKIIGKGSDIPSWFILKPQRRTKKEILHPAKFPEELASIFISDLTKKQDNVFDPMSGTGSTQLASLMLGRNAYGTELSSYFAEIARERALSYLFEYAHKCPVAKKLEIDIVEADARLATKCGFPQQQLIFTSPPYWDMLNMKGAENQAKRIEKGLRTNYSDDNADLGNIIEYDAFVKELSRIYAGLADLLKPGGHFVIVVKNIKKKGKNYPFAWDLAAAMQKYFMLIGEVFWCQDDISIAPYGYGNTFVSNTFHQYCLIFQKPE